ncbi:MAG: hypothetical protein GXX85_13460 [Ignavibacteria bacterium]|nr:hypothetical protein [Ignavibacteria bacterium]
MQIIIKNIELDKIKAVANFAKEMGIERKYTYRLLNEDVLDWILIDGVKFIYLSEKSLSYTKRKYIKQ